MKLIAHVLVVVFYLANPGVAQAFLFGWTEARLTKTLKKMDSAEREENWRRGIKYGERALGGCKRLRSERDPLCIAIMRRNATYYYNNGVHRHHATAIEHAYQLAREELGRDHFSTTSLRDIHYRVLIAEKHFVQAIPVLQERLQTERAVANEPYKVLDLTLQLYGLYHLTDQVEQEEGVLEILLPMVGELIGKDGDDYRDVATALAESYCARGKYAEFFSFAHEHQLDLRCSSRDSSQ